MRTTSDYSGRGYRSRNYKPVVISVSIVLIALIAALFLIPNFGGQLPENVDLTILPKANAILNSFTFVFLVSALIAVRRKRVDTHRRFILAAVAVTCLFFVSYVTYHFLAPATAYGGEGLLRSVYFFVLITHILSAIIVVPFALFSLFTGLNMEVRRHRRIARWAMPLWLYTSATGVLVYVLVSPYY